MNGPVYDHFTTQRFQNCMILADHPNFTTVEGRLWDNCKVISTQASLRTVRWNFLPLIYSFLEMLWNIIFRRRNLKTIDPLAASKVICKICLLRPPNQVKQGSRTVFQEKAPLAARSEEGGLFSQATGTTVAYRTDTTGVIWRMRDEREARGGRGAQEMCDDGLQQ